jgi:hypothetical protein
MFRTTRVRPVNFRSESIHPRSVTHVPGRGIMVGLEPIGVSVPMASLDDVDRVEGSHTM